MKKFRLILCMLLMLSLVFAMPSCDDGGEDDGTEESEETKESTENINGDTSTDATDGETNETTGSTEDTNDTAKGTEKGTEKSTQKVTQGVTMRQQNYSFLSATVLKKLKTVGRTSKVSSGLAVDHSASGIEFNAYIRDDLKLTLDVSNQTTYFTVYVDGVRLPTRYEVAAGTNKTLLIEDVGNGNLKKTHEIKIIKQIQSQWSLNTFKKLEFYGALDSAVDEKDYFIEIIGDSITCGHGNLVANGAVGEDKSLGSDATQAYSFLTAQKLDADYSLVSHSGIGITAGWSKNKDRTAFLKMGEFYKYNSWQRNDAGGLYTATRKADLVVINLGTNDSYFPSDSPKEQFKTDAKALIAAVRTNHGANTPVVWVYGMMHTGDYNTYIQEVISELGGASAGLYTVGMTQNVAGGQGHPTVAAHQAAATTLANFIEDNNLLNYKKTH